ncbi:hypothetical protein VPNG_07765 [Cytospora leucostoma]|uniref:Zn(2)-C6 fungal-type domain-containing protein n=1 Tax=Cytospora leucostoma TaxID=1230097 RepID=A0A423W8A8_9PEZI|nr:hypothetical protein VPNG_07765 [Cytospora leucostoma]
MSSYHSFEASERRSLESSEPPAKRRRVRKGTKSCWECRRRKIKCQFDTSDDVICIGCKQREAVCRSQEYDNDDAPAPGQKDPLLTRRLDRLEQMMEQILDRLVPNPIDASGPGSNQSPTVRRSASASALEELEPERIPASDILQDSATGDGPVAALLAMRHESVHRSGPSKSARIALQALPPVESSPPTLPADSTSCTQSPMRKTGRELPSPKHFWVCTTLRSVIPSQSALDAIIAASPGAHYVAIFCYSDAERQSGKAESKESIAIIPPMSSHPLLLAKRALQVLICIQKLPPAFDWDVLGVALDKQDVVLRLGNTALLVTSNDDLVGYAEGVECLLLQTYHQANSGSLRKAWITLRRAISLAQVMAIDRGHSAAFRSCDPQGNPSHRPSAKVLWYRLIFLDRYLSLLLGLPVGSEDDSFASGETLETDTPAERLEKAHTALSGRILERNRSQQQQETQPMHQLPDYAATQRLDLELEAAAKALPPSWWDGPRLDSFASQEVQCEAIAPIVLQIHHYTLLILLHVPYMLRDPSSPRFDYSKTTCMTSARMLLTRFITFRSRYVSACSCRRVDYAGLIAAMTLCLAYLVRRKGERWERIPEDAELIESTRRRMEHVAGLTGDRLNREIARTIESLASIINKAVTDASSGTGRPADASELQFNVPYLGSITVRLAGPRAPEAGPKDPALGSMDNLELPSLPAGLMQFAPYDDQAPLGSGTEVLPDLMADGEAWALQGVDSAYWSLFDMVT